SVIWRGAVADRNERAVVELRKKRLQLLVVELEQRARRLARFDEQREDAIAVLLDEQRQRRREVGRHRLVDDFAQLRVRAVPQQPHKKRRIRPRGGGGLGGRGSRTSHDRIVADER